MPPVSTMNDSSDNDNSQTVKVHHSNQTVPKMVTLFTQPASMIAVSPVRVLNNTTKNPDTTQRDRKQEESRRRETKKTPTKDNHQAATALAKQQDTMTLEEEKTPPTSSLTLTEAYTP